MKEKEKKTLSLVAQSAYVAIITDKYMQTIAR